MLYIGIDLGTPACKLLLVAEDCSILSTALRSSYRAQIRRGKECFIF